MAYVRFELHRLYAGVRFLPRQPTVPPSVRTFWMLPYGGGGGHCFDEKYNYEVNGMEQTSSISKTNK